MIMEPGNLLVHLPPLENFLQTSFNHNFGYLTEGIHKQPGPGKNQENGKDLACRVYRNHVTVTNRGYGDNSQVHSVPERCFFQDHIPESSAEYNDKKKAKNNGEFSYALTYSKLQGIILS